MAEDLNQGSAGDAQQALDDLTVLSNVQTQSLGETRLTLNRAIDVNDGGMGSLAMVHQGSTSAPSVQTIAQAATGIADHVDIAVDQVGGTVQIGTVDNIQLEASQPFENPQVVEAGVVIQHLPDLAAPAEIFGTPAAPVEQVHVTTPVASAPPTVTAANISAATQAAASETAVNNAPNVGGVFKIQAVEPDNAAPTGIDPSKLTTGEDGSIKFGVIASDPDGDPLTITVGGGQHGTVTQSGGQWVYNPDADYNGIDSFVVSV
ncbi:MAG: Ig-like domain-containing protein, partial [Actinomycetota bacterium]